jgi:hypothetical protein
MSTLLTVTTIVSRRMTVPEVRTKSNNSTRLKSHRRTTTLERKKSSTSTATIPSNIETTLASMSTLSITEMTTSQKIKPTVTLQLTSKTIEQTSSPTTTTTQMTKTLEKISSKTDLEVSESPIPILLTLITQLTSTEISRTTRTSFTPTESSEKTRNTLLYITYKLPFVILCIPIIIFFVFSLCYRCKQRHILGDDLDSISDTSNTDIYSSTIDDMDRSKTPSSSLSTQ